jgi:hypothetical protein
MRQPSATRIRNRPRSAISRPHGSPTVSTFGPMRRFATIVSTKNRPTVTMAAAKGGSPTIGRRAIRSDSAPMSATASIARMTDSANGTPSPRAK